jgi:hypothetical protein
VANLIKAPGANLSQPPPTEFRNPNLPRTLEAQKGRLPNHNLVRFAPIIEAEPGNQGPREEIKVSPTYGATPRPDRAIVGVISLTPITGKP